LWLDFVRKISETGKTSGIFPMRKFLGFFFTIASALLVVYYVYKKLRPYMERIRSVVEEAQPVIDSVQNWAKEDTLSNKMEVVKSVSALTRKPATSKPRNAIFDLNDRQKEIYDIVKREVEVGMHNLLAKLGGGVTDRTLRRDMTKLERLGLIKQVGKTKGSFYKLRD